MNRIFIAQGAILMALAVALGAYSSHGLKGFSESSINLFKLGVQYHIYHAIGLIAIGIIAGHLANKQIKLAGNLMLIGIILFSGGLYFYAITEIETFKIIIPFGGLSLIASWLAIIWAIFSKDNK